MVRRFCGDEQIENVLLNPGYGISDHCLRQDNSLRAAQRAIAETRRTERAGAAHGRSGWQERRRDDGHDKQQERHDDTRHQDDDDKPICPMIWQGKRAPDQEFAIDVWLP